jgi:hypothetical protein
MSLTFWVVINELEIAKACDPMFVETPLDDGFLSGHLVQEGMDMRRAVSVQFGDS